MPVFRGGCQCGAVRYSVRAKRLVTYACHCLECQKQAASSFALSVPVMRENFEMTGPTEIYTRPTDSGTHTNCCFCKNCGTRLYHQSESATEIITLKGGTLDDTSNLTPVAHLWTKRKQDWIQLNKDADRFETQPADLKTWRESLLRHPQT